MAEVVGVDGIVRYIRSLAELTEERRVAAYNVIVAAAAAMVSGVSDDPACRPQLVPADQVEGNDYNPNKVAAPELDLLEESIKADGITMALVVMTDLERDRWVVIDGFHRHRVATERLGRRWVPCTVLERPLADRMASTVRHNRARGKHQVELMAALVKALLAEGLDDEQMAVRLGMSVEELLRLRQMVGAARIFAADEYSRSWGTVE